MPPRACVRSLIARNFLAFRPLERAAAGLDFDIRVLVLEYSVSFPLSSSDSEGTWVPSIAISVGWPSEILGKSRKSTEPSTVDTSSPAELRAVVALGALVLLTTPTESLHGRVASGKGRSEDEGDCRGERRRSGSKRNHQTQQVRLQKNIIKP